MQNPGYGGGQSGQTFGYLRDLWHASRSGDPLRFMPLASHVELGVTPNLIVRSE